MWQKCVYLVKRSVWFPLGYFIGLIDQGTDGEWVLHGEVEKIAESIGYYHRSLPISKKWVKLGNLLGP